jgi:hypothetical protein
MMKNFRLLGNEDVLPESGLNADFEGKTLVLAASVLGENYRHGEFQLWGGAGGFGCNPEAMGTAVFVKCLHDGEDARFRRGDFLGVVKPEVIQEYEAWTLTQKTDEEKEAELIEAIQKEAKRYPMLSLRTLGTDLQDVTNFVADVITLHIEQTQKYEPHATKSIRRMEEAWRVVTDLADDLDVSKLDRE